MPSTKSIACAVATAGCLASTANAFWLIPGTHKSHHNKVQDVIPAYPTTANELKETVQEQYNKFTGKHDTEKPSRSVVRALEEVTTDIGSHASQAKSVLSRGLYFRENEDLYLLAVDIPGLHTREVEIIADRSTLTVKGERKCTLKDNKKEAVDSLCIDRSFDASFTFPSDADQDKTDARLDAGVVYVTVPKLKGERRGVGRILKLTGDAAEWVYESTGAKSAYDAAAGTAADAADKVQDAAATAKNAAYGAAYQARDAAQDTADSIRDSANHAANQARDAADRAAGNVRDTANQARDTAYDAANKARDAAYNAKYTAYDAAGNVRDNAYETANRAKDTAYNAKDNVYEAANRARDAAYDTKENAYAAAGDAKHKAYDAAGNAKEQAQHVYDNAKDGEQRKGFVENIKRKIVGPGSSEGKVPVEKSEL